ncbi:MAG: aminotransferase class III-fold pyridoxal phosphate-dependent enzyme [bacterium]|nr:aminotransferase class III-fold pyridoxal phosphate-dependent enzyme [bacterium]
MDRLLSNRQGALAGYEGRRFSSDRAHRDIKLYEDNATGHYGDKAPVVVDIANSRGLSLTDTDGNRYLDMSMAYSTAAVTGYTGAPRDLIDLMSQGSVLPSQAVYTPQLSRALELANRTFGPIVYNPHSQPTRVLMLNTGGEIVDAVQQTVKRYFGESDTVIFIPKGNFNGRREFANRVNSPDIPATFDESGALNVDAHRRCFIDFNDAERLSHAVQRAERMGLSPAILLEPVQGEGGVYPVSNDYVSTINSLQQDGRLLVVSDEVQTWGSVGVRHHGSVSHYLGLTPDIFMTAKCISPFYPMSLAVMRDSVATAVRQEGGTFSGNPFACASFTHTMRFAFTPQDRLGSRTPLDYLEQTGLERQALFAEMGKENPALAEVVTVGRMGGDSV